MCRADLPGHQRVACQMAFHADPRATWPCMRQHVGQKVCRLRQQHQSGGVFGPFPRQNVQQVGAIDHGLGVGVRKQKYAARSPLSVPDQLVAQRQIGEDGRRHHASSIDEIEQRQFLYLRVRLQRRLVAGLFLVEV